MINRWQQRIIDQAQDDNRRIKYIFLIDKGFSPSQARTLAKLSWQMIERIIRQSIK